MGRVLDRASSPSLITGAHLARKGSGSRLEIRRSAREVPPRARAAAGRCDLKAQVRGIDRTHSAEWLAGVIWTCGEKDV